MTPPPVWSPNPPASSPFTALGIISAPSPSVVTASLHPLKQVAVRLWKIYVDNVDGCTGLKLLHPPTHSIVLYSTIDNPAAAPLDNLAMAFAVYFASALSLSGPVADVILGQDKTAALLQFKLGLEQAFAHGDFLDRPTLTGIHALTIYLVCCLVCFSCQDSILQDKH